MPTRAPIPPRQANRLRNLTDRIGRGETAAEERAELILQLRSDGYTLQSIADTIGVSIQAVSNVIAKRKARAVKTANG